MSKFVFILLTLLLLNSCSEKQGDLKKYIDLLKAKKIQTPEFFSPTPSISALKISLKENTRNPFKPVESNNKKRINSLNAYSLSTLKFVGLIGRGAKVWALIEQPNALIIKVKVGDTLGKNKALVKSIRADALILEEPVEGMKKQRIILHMKSNL